MFDQWSLICKPRMHSLPSPDLNWSNLIWWTFSNNILNILNLFGVFAELLRTLFTCSYSLMKSPRRTRRIHYALNTVITERAKQLELLSHQSRRKQNLWNERSCEANCRLAVTRCEWRDMRRSIGQCPDRCIRVQPENACIEVDAEATKPKTKRRSVGIAAAGADCEHMGR